MSRLRFVTVVVIAAAALPAPAMAQSGSGSSSRWPLVVAIAVAVIVVLLGLLFAGFGMSRAAADVRHRLGRIARPVESTSRFSRLPLVGRLVRRAEEEAKRRGVLEAVNAAVERAGLPIRSGEAITAAVLLSVVVGVGFGAATASVLVGVAAAGAGIILTVLAIQAVASRETRRFESQMPDSLNLLGSSLRAGYSLLQAVEAVAREAPAPTSREFGRAVSEIRLGTPVTTALKGIAARMGSVDFEWVTMAIEIQSEVGGNLAEVLQSTANTIVLRNRLRGDVRAMTAEGRISALVLAVLPFGLGLFMWTTNRDYIDPLFSTTGGRVGLVVALALLAAGISWIRSIVNVEP
jgi:tight adherence protein B